MSAVLTRIAGMAIRDSALARDATEFVRDAATQMLFDHSRRVFRWASLKAEPLSVEDDAELVYVRVMLHGLGEPREAHYAVSNGYLTLLSDGERLTGVHALGPEAGEWLRQATLAIHSDFAAMQPVEEVAS